jgi:FtsP/CotA-like multicopper oxidase with cupredoxin domain
MSGLAGRKTLARPSVARPVLVSWITLGCLLAACGVEEPTEPADQVGGDVDEQADLTDTNPDDDIVEVELTAAVGSKRYLLEGRAEVWGYRDGAADNPRVTVPGPRLELRKGQRVIVHFTNELPEPTTIHWHGLRVPNTSDGTPSVQAEVNPGETFDYTFEARDAGTFWYHPHVRSDEQIERGLYGVVRVREPAEQAVTADRTIVLDDVKLNANGKLSSDTTSLDVMLGRQGNVILANGVRSGQVTVRAGARERWRFVNAANGRYFNLRLQERTFEVIAWDGGLLAEPYEAETLLIAPGERYEVLVNVAPSASGAVKLETLHYDRGHNVPDPGPTTVFTMRIEGKAEALDPWGARDIEPAELVVPDGASERKIELSEEENAGGFPRFFVNGMPFPDVPPLNVRAGDIEIWSIHNDSEMDHPFHLHGMFFRVLDVDGAASEHSGWKDTVNVPRKQTLHFAVRYGDAGTWMYHCHILEHAERGMMAELHVTSD